MSSYFKITKKKSLSQFAKYSIENIKISERQILAEYEAGMSFDEAALTATLECLRAVDVLCPVCTRWACTIYL